VSETLIVTLSLVLNSLLPYLIVRRDLSRLSDERLARAWTEASFLAAVLAFGPLSLPVHFVKTRRSVLGLGLGLGFCALSVAAQGLLATLLGAVLGVVPE
jgi:hypothetical protein